MLRVAINGFGRIGRNALKAGWEKKGVEFVAVNDLTEPQVLAHLLKYDSAYGMWDEKVSFGKDFIMVGKKKIKVLAQKEPALLPWRSLKVDVVLECTGFFTTEELASAHLTAGAKRVIISAPAKGGNVPTHVIGVNEGRYDGKSRVINNASCTTNCIAPVAAILHSAIGIKKALMTTIHGVTAEQNLVDGPPPGHHGIDLRRARAAYANMVPTSTGAAIATTETIPELQGLFDGRAVRVPIIVGSLIDFTFLLAKKTTVEDLNSIFVRASKQPRWKGVVAASFQPLVSTDIIGRPESAIVDLGLTQVVDGDLAKVIAWYDNEWGYSNRLVEMAQVVGKTLR